MSVQSRIVLAVVYVQVLTYIFTWQPFVFFPTLPILPDFIFHSNVLHWYNVGSQKYLGHCDQFSNLWICFGFPYVGLLNSSLPEICINLNLFNLNLFAKCQMSCSPHGPNFQVMVKEMSLLSTWTFEIFFLAF